MTSYKSLSYEIPSTNSAANSPVGLSLHHHIAEGEEATFFLY